MSSSFLQVFITFLIAQILLSLLVIRIPFLPRIPYFKSFEEDEDQLPDMDAKDGFNKAAAHEPNKQLFVSMFKHMSGIIDFNALAEECGVANGEAM